MTHHPFLPPIRFAAQRQSVAQRHADRSTRAFGGFRLSGLVVAAAMILSVGLMEVGGGPTPASAADGPSAPAGTAAAAKPARLLGPPFESPASGIVLCPPAGTREVRRVGNDDEIVQFIDDQRSLSLRVSRIRFSRPVQLGPTTAQTAAEGSRPPVDPAASAGLLAAQLTNLSDQISGIELLRNEITVLGEGGSAVQTGLLAFRYVAGSNLPASVAGGGGSLGKSVFRQQALIRATDQLYYLLDMTALGGNPGKGVAGASEEERSAAELFAAVLESVQLEDRADVRRDQEERLFRTRALFVNINAARLKNAVVAEAWYRIVRNGKDIGFTEVRQKTLQQGGKTGVQIDLYTRTQAPDGKVIEVVSDMFMAEGRTPEQWKTIARVGRDSKNVIVERGVSQIENIAPARTPQPSDDLGASRKKQPLVLGKDVYKLKVTYAGAMGGGGSESGQPAIDRPVPPWYIPQAMGHLLPRLLPLDQPKTFLFGYYVSDQREVMMRYIDVLPETDVIINHKTLKAVPVRDRIGLSGSPTTHYLTRAGEYLGAVSAAAQIEILPSDQATVAAIWKGDMIRLNDSDAGPRQPGPPTNTPLPTLPTPPTPPNPAAPTPGVLPR